MQIWIYCWTALWFVALVVFSFLSALIIVYGAVDLVALLRSLKTGAQAKEETADTRFPNITTREKTAS